MNDFLLFLLCFATGYFGVKLTMFLIRGYLERRLEEMHAELEAFRRSNIACRVERHGDIFYIYDVDTGDFVAQGGSVEEIRDHVAQTRYRGLRVFVAEGDEDVIQALTGTHPDMGATHA